MIAVPLASSFVRVFSRLPGDSARNSSVQTIDDVDGAQLTATASDNADQFEREKWRRSYRELALKTREQSDLADRVVAGGDDECDGSAVAVDASRADT
jgi:hypothetical protein